MSIIAATNLHARTVESLYQRVARLKHIKSFVRPHMAPPYPGSSLQRRLAPHQELLPFMPPSPKKNQIRPDWPKLLDVSLFDTFFSSLVPLFLHPPPMSPHAAAAAFAPPRRICACVACRCSLASRGSHIWRRGAVKTALRFASQARVSFTWQRSLKSLQALV